MPTWLTYALLSALFAALTAIFTKIGLKNIQADLATAIRTIFILGISWLFVFAKGKEQGFWSLSKNNWLFLFLSGAATGLSWLFYHRALQAGNTTMVNAIDKGSLVLVMLLSFFILREPVNTKLVIGVALMVAGMIVIVWK